MSNQEEQFHPVDAFTAFEAVHLSPATALDVPAIPALETAQHLLDWVLGDPLRNQNQKNNEAAAIRWLGRVDDTPLSTIPLDDVRYLVDDRYKRIRDHKPLTKIRRSNIVTLLNQVLVRAGILAVGTRRGGITSHAWTMLIKSVPGRDAIQSLSTLGKFCSQRGIEPPDVTLNTWREFADETLNLSTFKKPRVTLQKTLQASNKARATVPGWPLPEFPKLINPRLVSIPKEDLPKSFWIDLDMYVEKSSTSSSDIFDTASPRQLSPNTLARYREVATRTASAQVHTRGGI